MNCVTGFGTQQAPALLADSNSCLRSKHRPVLPAILSCCCAYCQARQDPSPFPISPVTSAPDQAQNLTEKPFGRGPNLMSI